MSDPIQRIDLEEVRTAVAAKMKLDSPDHMSWREADADSGLSAMSLYKLVNKKHQTITIRMLENIAAWLERPICSFIK